jgi:GNAT superfamily N-acetyltransferase
MTTFVIGKAVLGDMPEVSRVFKTSRLQVLPYLTALHSPEEDERYFSEVVFKHDEVCLAKDSQSSRIVGFVAFNREFVKHLYLLPEAQGQGIGARLLVLAQNSSGHLKLWTFQKNLAAQRFYLKHGFRIVAQTEGSANEENEPDILMEWKK